MCVFEWLCIEVVVCEFVVYECFDLLVFGIVCLCGCLYEIVVVCIGCKCIWLFDCVYVGCYVGVIC